MWLLRNANAIPNLLIVVGALLAAYNGYTLWQHESLTERQITQEAQQQLETLEDRRGPHLSPIQGERRQQLLERLRAEIAGVHEQPYRDASRWFFLGMGCLIIGLGHRLAGALQQRFV
ncbi:MAG: hypothetical protein MRY60_08155 [Algiphilus sp.]|uniref:hypothetical protein n=1 Tax=Algiphilus sp. TaxID=1872431 RepID=UPI0025C04119|nr:hypothetical protein [Algiphilus sp.]MCI5103738.1 hypothetical protein [Algiphilus sp.]